jgi:ABC-type uncharacterized transport system auxiliary subunit
MTRCTTVLLLCAGAFLASCASSPPAKEVFYRFLEPASVELSGPVIDGTLRVERLRAEGILSERALLFSREDSPGMVEQYRYHHWAEPPARLVTQGLLEYLQQANVADKVIADDIRTEVDYSIDGEVLRLERVLGNGTSRVNMEVLLRLQEFDSRELVLQKRYRETIAVQEDSLIAVVDALSLARERIYQRFVKDLIVFSKSDR